MPDGTLTINGKNYNVHFDKPPTEADLQDAYDTITKSQASSSPAAPASKPTPSFGRMMATGTQPNAPKPAPTPYAPASLYKPGPAKPAPLEAGLAPSNPAAVRRPNQGDIVQRNLLEMGVTAPIKQVKQKGIVKSVNEAEERQQKEQEDNERITLEYLMHLPDAAVGSLIAGSKQPSMMSGIAERIGGKGAGKAFRELKGPQAGLAQTVGGFLEPSSLMTMGGAAVALKGVSPALHAAAAAGLLGPQVKESIEKIRSGDNTGIGELIGQGLMIGAFAAKGRMEQKAKAAGIESAENQRLTEQAVAEAGAPGDTGASLLVPAPPVAPKPKAATKSKGKTAKPIVTPAPVSPIASEAIDAQGNAIPLEGEKPSAISQRISKKEVLPASRTGQDQQGNAGGVGSSNKGQKPTGAVKPETKSLASKGNESTKATPQEAVKPPSVQEVKDNPDKFLYHVSGIRHEGSITSQPFGIEKDPVVWLSKDGPTVRPGHVYAIDPSKVPGNIRNSRNGFPVHEGDIPENAYVYLGERSAHEPFKISQVNPEPVKAASNVRVAQGKAFIKTESGETVVELPQNAKERLAVIRTLQDQYDNPKPQINAGTPPAKSAVSVPQEPRTIEKGAEEGKVPPDTKTAQGKAPTAKSAEPAPSATPSPEWRATFRKGLDSGMNYEEAGKEADRQHGPVARPSDNSSPPANAPIVGGVPKSTGGSDAPPSAPVLKAPTFDVKTWGKEASRVMANYFGRNLTGVERAAESSGDKRILRAARTAANAATHFQVAAARAIPAIRKAIGGNEASVQSFWNHLAESRLRGVRQRWGDLRDEVLAMSDEDPGIDKRKMKDMEEEREPSLFDPKVLSKYTDILKHIQGKRRDSFLLDEGEEDIDTSAIEFTGKEKDPNKFDNNLVHVANTLASNGDMQTLRLFLATAFDDAYNSVGVMHEFSPSNEAGKNFEEYAKRPEVKKATQIYREEIGNPLTQAYRANKGIESDYLGPLDTYYPLMAKRPEGSGYPAGIPAEPFAKVNNPNAHFTTGLSEEYDTSQEAFLKAAEASMRANNKGALINTLQDSGLAHIIPRGTPFKDIPKTMNINGVDVPAVTEPYSGSFLIVKDGKSFRVRSQHILMPEFLADEMKPVLRNEEIDASKMRAAIGKLTEAAIFGPTAAVYHAHNLLGSLVAATPFVGKGIAGTVPGVKLFKAISTVASIDPSAPERAGDIQTLARIGQLHPKTASVTGIDPSRGLKGVFTGNRAAAETKGQKYAPVSAALYGLKGMDLRTRLALLDVARAMHEANGTTPTDEDLFNFISTAGTYTRGLDSGIERALKGSGIAPFITAGKTQISTGVRALTGTTHLPAEGLPKAQAAKYRAMQLLSGGIVGYTGLWLALNGIYHGKLPGRDDQFGRIKIKPSDRNSPMGQMIFGAGNSDESVSLAFFNPTLSRGARDAGVQALVNSHLAERDFDKTAEFLGKDILNGLASPVTTSPTVRIPMIALTGKAPYILNMSEKFGKSRISKPSFLDVVGENETGASRYLQQIKEALLHSNPYLEVAGQVTGLSHRREDRIDQSAGRFLTENILDLAFPRAFPMEMPKRGKKPHYSKAQRAAHGLP